MRAPNPIPHTTANTAEAKMKLNRRLAKMTSDAPLDQQQKRHQYALADSISHDPAPQLEHKRGHDQNRHHSRCRCVVQIDTVCYRSRCRNRCPDIAPVERLTNMCVIEIDQNAGVRNASFGVKS